MENFSSHYGQTSSHISTETRYKGLRNQGATCYLNSVLQCLYLTEEFREEVEHFMPDYSNVHMEHLQCNDLMSELKDLFKKIKESDGTTNGITQSLRISNVHEQQDAVEYYQKILKAIDPQASKVFEGVMNNKTKCSENHISHEKHNFFTIPLAIEAEHSEVFDMVKGLQTFFNFVTLDEDNWLYCKDCGKKTETKTWNDVEVFPTILTLYLKRFYFDYNQMRPVKNHCLMDISLKLELSNIGYSLYAVINHIGDEHGGHYNVFIKSFEDGEWYCFDDISVTNVSDTFFLHSRTAFLLMYRKLDQLSSEKSTHEPYCATESEKHVKVTDDGYLHYVTSLIEILKNYAADDYFNWQKLDNVNNNMKAYRQNYDWLIQRIARGKKWLGNIKAMTISDIKQLFQEKKRFEELQNKLEECKNYASGVQELAMLLESLPPEMVAFLKENLGLDKMESCSDRIKEEIHNLHKCYHEVLMQTTEYINSKMNNQPVREAGGQQKEELSEPRNIFLIKAKSQQTNEVKAKNGFTKEESAPEGKEWTEKKVTQVQQNLDETEDQNQGPNAKAAKHAKSQENIETLRDMTKTEGKNEFHLTNDVALQSRLSITNETQSGDGKHCIDPASDEKSFYAQPLKNCKSNKQKKLLVEGLQRQVTWEQKEQKHERNPVSNSSVHKFIAAGVQQWKRGMGPIAGILVTDTQEKLSVRNAIDRKQVDGITGQRLLEAQACTGGIIDPNTGKKFTVEVAVDKGLVDKRIISSLTFAQKAFQGFEDSKNKTKMSVGQVLNENALKYIQLKCFLEVQCLTGGLIEPDVASRVSLDDAVKKGTLDLITASKLQDSIKHLKYLKCPKTNLIISYKDAMEKSLIEEGSGLLFLEA